MKTYRSMRDAINKVAHEMRETADKLFQMNLYIKATLLFFFLSCNSQVNNTPESINDVLKAGFIALQNGDTALANQKTDVAFLIDSNNANVWFLKTEILKKAQRYNQAILFINKAIEINPKSTTFYEVRAELYEFTGAYSNGLKDILFANSLDSNNARILNRIGNLMTLQGDLNGAIDYYNLAIINDSNNPALYYNRANYFSIIKDYKKSLNDCNRAIDLYDSDGLVYKRRADCYINIGNKVKACEDFTKALNLLKTDKEVEKAMKMYCE